MLQEKALQGRPRPTVKEEASHGRPGPSTPLLVHARWARVGPLLVQLHSGHRTRMRPTSNPPPLCQHRPRLRQRMRGQLPAKLVVGHREQPSPSPQNQMQTQVQLQCHLAQGTAGQKTCLEQMRGPPPVLARCQHHQKRPRLHCCCCSSPKMVGQQLPSSGRADLGPRPSCLENHPLGLSSDDCCCCWAPPHLGSAQQPQQSRPNPILHPHKQDCHSSPEGSRQVLLQADQMPFRQSRPQQTCLGWRQSSLLWVRLTMQC
mmetsp:Transcript_13876/g.40492  ORF Transcript_13876/g.40492 Transcript_13876/m.40492 type:complete len:260 (+) Transcript_13876:970-1749(+)